MYNSLPKYYKDSKVVKSLGMVEKEQLELLLNNIIDTLDNFFINSSKDLSRYEKIFGLPVNPNIVINERRARIKAKMQGSGTTSIDVIKNIPINNTAGSIYK